MVLRRRRRRRCPCDCLGTGAWDCNASEGGCVDSVVMLALPGAFPAAFPLIQCSFASFSCWSAASPVFPSEMATAMLRSKLNACFRYYLPPMRSVCPHTLPTGISSRCRIAYHPMLNRTVDGFEMASTFRAPARKPVWSARLRSANARIMFRFAEFARIWPSFIA